MVRLRAHVAMSPTVAIWLPSGPKSYMQCFIYTSSDLIVRQHLPDNDARTTLLHVLIAVETELFGLMGVPWVP